MASTRGDGDGDGESQGYRSLTGRPETTEPSRTVVTHGQPQPQYTLNSAILSTRRSRDGSPVTIRHASSTSSVPTLRKHSSSGVNTPQLVPSTNNSPHTSRNPSPIRTARSGHDAPRSSSRPSAPALRSRQNSNDQSPHRSPGLTNHNHGGTVPSAAAIQRALSATAVPQLQAGPVTEAVSKLPKMQQRSVLSSGESTPTWPPSPRLKSPPPSTVRSRTNSSMSQRGSTSAPSIHVQSSTPTSVVAAPSLQAGDSARSIEARKEEQLQPTTSTTKAPSRGPSGPRPTLETVEENTTPQILVQQPVQNPTPQMKQQIRTSDEEKTPSVRVRPSGYISDATSKLAESESEGNRSGDGKGRKASQDSQVFRPKVGSGARTSYPTLSSAKSRQPEGSRNMTVETETVASVPQTNIGGGSIALDRGRDGGSLRTKPSTDTIRPRKDRKRASRKAPSINNGTASSKADIFEARVATQVDEQGSSSDETFVYESNTEPPERTRRHHSRTPSGTSLHSQSEYRLGIRNYGGLHNGDHRVAGKRSMKFSNNPYNMLDSPSEDGNGTVRAHARHIGRLGRAAGSSGRGSLYLQDSPFTQASKFRNTDRQSSRPGSPKSTTSTQHRPTSLLLGRKNDMDLEGGEGDDERTPLVGTVRTLRSSRLHARRYNTDSLRSHQSYYDSPHHAHSLSSGSSSSSRLSRFGGCLFGLVVFILVVLGAVGFLVMSNKPLYGFEVDRIENVLASEQEIMLDLLVGAVNPNVLGVTVADMDINIFAKSKYVSPIGGGHVWHHQDKSGSRKNSRMRVRNSDHQDPDGHWHPGHGPDKDHDGQDEGNDPMEGDSQTMLLGRIFQFDTPLIFDGSPIKRHTHLALGEVRLQHPGNSTEMGGSERWERVLQYPFELILRGVLKYQLPVSSKTQSAAIGASVYVHPEEGLDAMGNMRVEEVDRSERWQWIEFEDLDEDNTAMPVATAW
ncbi:hypothetical protein AAFC00_001011 [Neodothiora populina]|uniref:Uncharacterized protein n=1 Tax=Neodothiora populina TaxID=2781224 RepID=A0ABR3PMH3_9PEZI